MLIHGRVSNDNVVPLLLDASGNVIVSAAELTTTGGKLHVDINGNLIVSANQLTTTGGKILIDSVGRVETHNLPVAGSAPYTRALIFDNLNLPAGASTQTVGTVTAGELWQIDQIIARYDGTVAGVQLLVRQTLGSGSFVHTHSTNLVTGIYQIFNVSLLSDGNTVWDCSVIGATLNDDLRIRVFGRRIN